MLLSGCKYKFKLWKTKQKHKKSASFLFFFFLCSMNLVLDIGNTRVKAAVFKENTLVDTWVWERSAALKNTEDILSRFSIKSAMVASVGGSFKELTALLEDSVSSFYILSSFSVMPFEHTYKTPLTLGVDRLAVVAAAQFLYPKKNCLIIDAGSCITYELLTSSGVYLGGGISPGVQMRYNAMNTQTASLPLLSRPQTVKPYGESTESCMHSGVVLGVCHEIEGWIQSVEADLENLTVILTGGDAKYLSKQLKNTIFAHPNLALIGINQLLQYQITHA
jgi:type III pantothenate kinase